MAKRRRHTKLPNGFGSIKYLGGNRRNPYAVHPPVKDYTLEGIPITPKALCYVPNWTMGMLVLTAYHNGTYYPGYEQKFDQIDLKSSEDILIREMLANFNRSRAAAEKLAAPKITFAEVYADFYKYKYDESGREYSQASKNSTTAAFKNCSRIHNRAFTDLNTRDLQEVIDRCPLRHASKELIVSLFKQMYEYAMIFEIIEKNYAVSVRVGVPEDDEHGVPFTPEQLRSLWAHSGDDTVDMLLIMCYSGFRIAEYKGMTVNIDNWSMTGGLKTEAGKDRVVPIHTLIRPLVLKRIEKYGCMMPVSARTFRMRMYETLERLGIERHTPHDTRHTFAMLCEKYRVPLADQKRMMGHKSNDLTLDVYGHRTLEELRESIEMIHL